ncbi:MAG: NADH-quinone oxidoreductase subunit NuoE [Candidatus Dormibacteria bacterium]
MTSTASADAGTRGLQKRLTGQAAEERMALAEATRAEIVRARDRYPHPGSAILPALWAVQHELGYLSAEGMAEVADLLGLAPSQVQAVSTFYSMYFNRPSGRHHLLVCVNVACALRGADDIVAHMGQRLGCASGETTADGAFTWESTVECLGACGGAPAMQVDHHFAENLTTERVDALLEELRGAPTAHAARTPDGAPASRPAAGPHPPSGVTPPAPTSAGPPGATSTVTDTEQAPGRRRGARAAKRSRLSGDDL